MVPRRLPFTRTVPGSHLPRVLWTGLLTDYSGYAEEARALLHGLISLGVDVQINPINRAGGAVPVPSEFRELLSAPFSSPHKGPSVHIVHIGHKPWLDLSSAVGDRVVWRTMFETSSLPSPWVKQAEVADEVWVPSTFNIRTFSGAGVARSKLRRIPEPIDTMRFDPDKASPTQLPVQGFVFLSIFSWDLRKGWDILLRAYVEEFSAQEPVALVIKAAPLNSSVSEIQRQVCDFLVQIGNPRMPQLLLLTEDVPPEEMPSLYRAADAFVLPSRGEGWGRPYMEAMAMGLPTIGTRWSGNLDFMTDCNSYLIDCSIEIVSPMAARELPHYSQQYWAQPSVAHLRELMRTVFEEREQATIRGSDARAQIHRKYSLEAVARLVINGLQRIFGQRG
jgi:glycosyltransferase involved in cell wall biosynthesis